MDIDLPETFIRQRLPAAQSELSRAVADEEGQSFLAHFDVPTQAGVKNAARVRSVVSGPSSTWLEAVPAAAHLRLSKAAFLAAARHLLRHACLPRKLHTHYLALAVLTPPPWPRHAPHGRGTGMRLRT